MNNDSTTDADKPIPIMVVVGPTFGSDPELFVKISGTEVIVPVLDLLGGTKKEPRPLPAAGFFVQEDNVLAEFNIPPAATRDAFVSYIHQGIALVKEALPVGFIPLIRTSYRFEEHELQDPRAKEFGCDPDMNAWTEEENERPSTDDDPTLRVAGGHLTTGYSNSNPETNNLLVKFYDAFLAVPSILLDKDSDRRKLYGKAGSYRNKDFGVEYRTLSSFWLGSPELTGWVWDQAMLAIDHLNRADYKILEHEAFIIDTVNNSNIENAKRFVKEYGLKLPS